MGRTDPLGVAEEDKEDEEEHSRTNPYLGLLQVAVHGLSDVCGMHGVVVGVLGVVVVLHHAWQDKTGMHGQIQSHFLFLHGVAILTQYVVTSTLQEKGKQLQ